MITLIKIIQNKIVKTVAITHELFSRVILKIRIAYLRIKIFYKLRQMGLLKMTGLNIKVYAPRIPYAVMAVFMMVSTLLPFIQVDTAYAASQGPRYATASGDCVDAGGGDIAWTSPGNAYRMDDVRATSFLTYTDSTNYLKCTNFGFSIPTGATINGIELTVDRSSSDANRLTDGEISLVKSGTVQAHDKGDLGGEPWPTTEASRTYGSSSDLWGTTWTVANINASNFGVVVSAFAAYGLGTARVDSLSLTVHYTPSTTFEQSGYRWFNNQDADKSTFAVGWGTPGDDIARDVAVDSAGNSYVVGYAASRYGQASNSMDQTLVKYNKNGVEQWSKTWGGTGTDYAWDVELDSSGNIYVAGYTDSSDRTAGGNDQTLVKYNSDGIEQWSKTWGSASYHDFARGLALDASGNIYVVGSAGSATNGYDQTLVKYNSSGLEQWSKTWGGTGADRALGVALDASLNIYVVGETASTDRSKGLLDQTLVKYNSSGVEQWSKTWGDTGDDSAWGIVLDSSTNIYVVGYTDSSIFSAGLKDQTLVKYNSLGVEQWSKTWGDTADDAAFDVDLDASGNIYVVGYTESYTSGLEDQSLIKYNSSGVEQWTKTWGSSSNDEDAHAVWVDDDTNIIVAGYAMSTDLSGGGQDQTLLKFDSTGAIADCTSYCVDRTTAETNRITAETNRVVGETNVITAEVDRAVSEKDFSWLMKTLVHCGDVASFVSSWGGSDGYSSADVAVDADENAYVVGADGYSQVLVKFDSVGIEQWSKSWGGDGYSEAYGVALDSSGNIFVVGSSNSTGLSSETTFGDQTLVKYNSSGVEQWSKSWGGDGLDEAYDVALDSSGNIYVVGYSKSSGLSSETTYGDQTLVKYNSSGVEQWSKSWGGAGIDIAHKLALDSSGNIFVVGSSNSTGLSSETAYGDQTLVKYNSSGVEQWSKSWGGDRSDIAYGIALDSSGNIYTTGISASTGLSSETTDGDQTLVKYNSSGVEQWSKSMGDVGYDVGYAVTVSSAGDIYVSGDWGSQSIVKYNSNGDVQWHKYSPKTTSYFGFEPYLSQGIAISSSGNIFAAGLVEETAAFPIVYSRLTVIKTLPTATDISGAIRADYSTAVDRTATEVDRTIVEVNRDTVEVNRVTGETNIDTAEIFENEVIAEPTIDVGAPLNNVAQNTATLAPSAGPFRLRLGLHVGTGAASPGTSFKLQYAQKSGTCDTAFTGESYADVTSGTPVAFYDNTNGYDGLLMKANANDPTHSGHSNVMQEYQEANNAEIINEISVGSDGLWDFALTADSAPANTSYCFRMVTSTGSALNTYSVVPEITTPPLDFEQTSHRWFDGVGGSTFATTWGGNSDDDSNDVVIDSAGNIYVVGSTYSTNLTAGNSDQTIVKYNSSGVEQWSKSWGGTGYDVAYAVALDDSGNIYVVGSSNSTGLSSETTFGDQTLVKYNSSGVEQWSKSWGGDGVDVANDIVLDTSGNIYVVGSSKSTGLSSETTDGDQTLVKYNSSGVEQWSKSWGGDGYDTANAIEIDSGGNIYVAGDTVSTGLTFAYVDQTLVKYNSSGVEQWSKSWGGDGYDTANAIEIDSAGNVFTVGYSYSTGLSSETDYGDQTLVKYNNSGVEQWSKSWGGDGTDIAYGVISDDLGNIFVSGMSNSTGLSSETTDGDQTLVKYNSSGEEQWSKSWGGDGTDIAQSIALGTSGNIFVIGTSDSSGITVSDYMTDQTLLAFDSAGSIANCPNCADLNTAEVNRDTAEVNRDTSEVNRDTVEVDRATSEVNRETPQTLVHGGSVGSYMVSVGGDSDSGEAVATDSAGNIYIAGTTYTPALSSGFADVLLTKYSSSGVEQWTKSWGGSTNEEATDIAVDSSGNIYVAGIADNGGTQLLIKFDSNGDELWNSEWDDSPGPDYANALALDTSGNIYVVGTSSSDGYGDQTLVKYNSSGVEQWSVFLEGDDYDEAFDVALDSSGNIYVVGTSASTGISSETTYGDQTLVKYNSSGVEQWTKSWGGTGIDIAYGIVLDGSGNIYTTGLSSSSGLSSETTYGDQTLVKYNSSGVEQWSKSWGGAGFDKANDITIDSSGNLYVAGSSRSSGLYSGGTWDDQTLVKYNATGVEQWSKSWGGYDEEDVANSVALDGSGSIYIAGMFSPSSSDISLIKTSTEDTDCGGICELRSTSEVNRTASEQDRSVTPYSNLMTNTVSVLGEVDRTVTESVHNEVPQAGMIVGSPLAAQDTAASLPRRDAAVRLRILLDPVKAATVSAADLKLQYAPKIGTCDVSFTGESFIDVGSGTGFNYYDNTAYSDGTIISDSGYDPTDGNTAVYQTYEESAPFTNPNTMTATGQSGLWDIALTAHENALGGSYCFRVVQQSSGAVLSSYDYIPELFLPPAMSQLMRHGNWFDASGVEQPFYW